jgi:hypothetical protein
LDSSVAIAASHISLACTEPAPEPDAASTRAGNRKVGEFLGKDFSSEEAKASAAKNAFALLGQHR